MSTRPDLFSREPLKGVDRDVALQSVAAQLSVRLAAGEALDRRSLSVAMEAAFGASDATGLWSMRDAYDALEAAQASMLDRQARTTFEKLAPAQLLEVLITLGDRLPTHSFRSEEQIAWQQFSTPLPIALVCAVAARIAETDVLLDPSAGTGLLVAPCAYKAGKLVLNEIDPKRAALLRSVFNTHVSAHDGEYIDTLLHPSAPPTVVLINPPFSRSIGRGDDAHAGARHLRAALNRLADSGRCVAVMPAWFSPNRSGRDGYKAVAKLCVPRLDMLIEGGAFAKHGTSINIRILVFDKGWQGETTRLAVQDLLQALAEVSGLTRLAPPSTRLPVRPALPVVRPSSLLSSVRKGSPIQPKTTVAIDEPPAPLKYRVLEAPRSAEEPVGIYVPYRVARIEFEGVNAHPTALVESIAMASILPPVPTLRPVLPPATVRALSDAQIETVIYATQAFSRDLPGRFKPNAAGTILEAHVDGHAYRQGYFIGDGTGAGKGRQVAATIFAAWCEGHRKAIWISKTTSLLEDARRDWSAVGGLSLDIQPIDGFPLGTEIAMEGGILFCTYATLRSQRHDAASRLQQILAWLGPGHEGMVVFDEAHAMANAAGTETKFGAQKGSEQGLAGVRLQNSLPRARVLYVSATGATDIANLCYASRLGLWGEGTAFSTREQFMSQMSDGGIAAMELVARDLKAQGLYAARAISFAGVEYEMLEHELTPAQIEIYDAYADAWQIIHKNLEAALAASGVTDDIKGETLNSGARNSALSRFESSKQRFFGQLLISMKLPSVIAKIKFEIEAGNAIVLQLVTTAEAMLGRRLADLSPEERANLDIELSPREYVIDYLRNAFPTRQMRVFSDEQGNARSEPMTDSAGHPVHCATALAARETLVERLCAMPAVGSALDEIIRTFGTDAVAEVTGRTKRLIWNIHGEQRLESRSVRTNIVETQAFMDASKRILAFSDAGGTGRSYHADRDAASALHRRIHLLLEPGWKAAEAIQGLGRSHRTNQLSAPVFVPCTTNCRGERRFISTIARRLDSLGALTRGQRQTGGQNLFDPADNLESDYAMEALSRWYRLLHGGKLKSITLDAFVKMTALRLTDKEPGALLDDLPPIQRWLNRILALRIDVQNRIFEEYLGLIEARIDAARQAGTLDVGVETILAEKLIMLDETILRIDPHTDAETRLLKLELHMKKRTTSYERMERMSDGTEALRLKNSRSGRVALRVYSYSLTLEDGSVVSVYQLIRPTGSERIREEQFLESSWVLCDVDEFRQLWDAEVEDAQSRLEVETVYLATGLLLPVWNKLPQHSVRVWRIGDLVGNGYLGRIIDARDVAKMASDMGVAVPVKMSLGEIVAAAQTRTGVAPPQLGGARLVISFVNNHHRIEVKDYPADRIGLFKSMGCFTEVIQFRTRLFVPIDRATSVIGAMLGCATTILVSGRR